MLVYLVIGAAAVVSFVRFLITRGCASLAEELKEDLPDNVVDITSKSR